MKDLIERSYQAICKRGLINESTTKLEFIAKMHEEDSEFFNEFIKVPVEIYAMSFKEIEELIDSITVRIMYLKHLGYNFEEEFEKVVIKNEKRAQ